MPEIGDEPWQMKHKFPDAVIAVDADRRHGIQQLLSNESTKDTEVILLDDAYQHRYVKAGLNILLTDYHRLITDDELLPAGRLREPVTAKERANIVIVTKCPKDMKPMDFRVVQEALNLKPYQSLYFSTLTPDTHVLLLTGIASPQQMLLDMHRVTRHITPLSFADHHDYDAHDVQRIEEAFTAMQGSKRLIITTEKDAARLRLVDGLSPIVRRHIYVLPIEVEFLRDEGNAFERELHDFVSHQQTLWQ